MARLYFVLPAAVALAVTVPTFASPTSTAGTGLVGSSGVKQVVVNLPKITVHGHAVPLPVQLQIIKKGLTLPWTNNMNDTRVRCRIESSAGTHFKTLYCEGNRHHIIRVRRLHTAMTTVMAGGGGSIPTVNATYVQRTNVSTLMALLHKIPPANASYTFRVTGDNGKPILDYVIKDGELVHAYHYVYETGKRAASGSN